MVIKAPSTESIQSWNVTASETLILKCNIEALDASAIEAEDEVDPFDTTEFEGIVKELKGNSEEDPFDTSAIKNLSPSKTELKLIESELIGEANSEPVAPADPFDTEFVKGVVPKEEEKDPFVTDPASEEPEDEDFDPFDTTVVEKVIPVRKPKVSQKSIVSIEDDDFDPSKAFVASAAKPAAPAWPEPDPFAPTEGKQQVAAPVPKQHHVAVVSGLRGRTRPKTRALIEAEEDLKRKQLEQQVWVQN